MPVSGPVGAPRPGGVPALDERSGVGHTDASTRYDVVVVGAGPAGALAARELAARGRRVLLVERERLPRAKLCGGCLHPRGVALLRARGLGHVLDEVRAVPLSTLELAVGERRLRFALPLGVALERSCFDAALVAAAVRAGAALEQGSTARSDAGSPRAIPSSSPPRRLILLGDDGVVREVWADLVVAADGLGSALLAGERGATRAAPGAPLGAGTLLARDALDEAQLPPGRVAFAVGRAGYVGRVRLPDGRIDLAAALHPRSLRGGISVAQAVAALLQAAGDARAAEAARAAHWRTTPALTRRPRRVWAERLLAVGDAAGFVEPFTGEGMTWALEGGALLGEYAAAGWRDDLGTDWQRAQGRRLVASRRRCALVSAGLRAPRLLSATLALLRVVPSAGRIVALHGHGR